MASTDQQYAAAHADRTSQTFVTDDDLDRCDWQAGPLASAVAPRPTQMAAQPDHHRFSVALRLLPPNLLSFCLASRLLPG